jgi:nitric oxide reductase subunit B
MPEPVVTDTATKVYSRPVMELVRQVWQSVGGQLLVSAEPAQAPAAVAAHYHSLFSNDPATHQLRTRYAMRENTVSEGPHRHAIAAFFLRIRWAAVTERPGQSMSHTQN